MIGVRGKSKDRSSNPNSASRRDDQSPDRESPGSHDQTRRKQAPPSRHADHRPRRVRNVKVRSKELLVFVNQLAVMVDTGVPLAQALGSIADRTPDPKLGDVLEQVSENVEAGEPLSTALARHRRAFPRILVALVKASEASGSMGTMLMRGAGYLNKEYEIKKQVSGAIMYPTMMFMLCVSITVFLITFILPKFATIYASRRVTLPGPTRILMGVSEELTTNWHWWLMGTGAVLLVAFAWRMTRMGRAQLDWLKLHAPLSGSLFNSLYVSRGFRTLATMSESGVPLLDSIGIVREVTENRQYDQLWEATDADLRRGKRISESLYASPVMPVHVAQMVESGEQSGRLGEVFGRIADFAEAEFERTVKTTTQFIEPVMIVTMGSIIGFIAIALLVPIFNVGRVVSGSG